MSKPIVNIESLKTLVQIAIAWVVVMGYWPMSMEQQALTISLGIAVVNVVGGYFETQQTTPLSDPRAKDGEKLVRSSGSTRSAASK